MRIVKKTSPITRNVAFIVKKVAASNEKIPPKSRNVSLSQRNPLNGLWPKKTHNKKISCSYESKGRRK